MSQDTNSELNNLTLSLSNIRTIEKKMNEAAQADTTTVSELRTLQMELQYQMGKLDEGFKDFLKKEGLPEQFHLLDVIAHFWRKAKSAIMVVQ
jgi:hypothetical protein